MFVEVKSPRRSGVLDRLDPQQRFFVDGREGQDRWGTPRAGKIVCGVPDPQTGGFGPQAHVCPAYVEEACPGARNRGNRTRPDVRKICDLRCHACGGGGWSDTFGICAKPANAPYREAFIAEVGGTLRLDAATVLKERPRFDPEGVEFFPTVEWSAKKWMEPLRLPAAGTTMKTAGTPGKTGIRQRLGGHEGILVVNGLTKDDLLDEVWDRRAAVLRFCRASKVDVMCTPQYSAYPGMPTMMALYNGRRIFQWYELCVEAGFPHVVLDVPPARQPLWLMDEYFAFIDRSKVSSICLSYQQFGDSDATKEMLWNARLVHRHIPPEVSVIVYGVTRLERQVLLRRTMVGRRLIFSDVNVGAGAAFFAMRPDGKTAPGGWEKSDVFAWNVEHATWVSLKARAVVEGAAAPAPPKRKKATREEVARQRQRRAAKQAQKRAKAAQERDEQRAGGRRDPVNTPATSALSKRHRRR